MYLEGRNYRSVIGNAVLLYIYIIGQHYIFYVTRHTFFFFSHGSN